MEQAFHKLIQYCENENYLGWDPYDGLNSGIFKTLAFPGKSPFLRLLWIQLFKKNPINLRRLLDIPKETNPKGLALILSGYCNIIKYSKGSGDKAFGDETVLFNKIVEIADRLISIRSQGYSGSCWGYNFDWQARRLFLFPKSIPTVVVTSFCAAALFDAYEITGESRFLNSALSSADFILKDLKRTAKSKGFLFSYSPIPGNDTVYNASLLGSKLLMQCFKYTANEEYRAIAKDSIEACVSEQNEDGSWFYGELPVQKWIDSFHTGYNLDSLFFYQQTSGDQSFSTSIEKGFEFYLKNFFLDDGTPKYYHNKIYPIDIHCPAQLVITLCNSFRLKEHYELVEKVLYWTIKNMQDEKGFFYYQKMCFFTNKIPYMRWSNAFMFLAFSNYLVARYEILKCAKNE